MAAKDTPSVEEVVAMKASNIAVPNPQDDKRTQDFLNEFASTPKQANDMREMIEAKSSVDDIFSKFFKGVDVDGPEARYFKAHIAKVVG